MKLEMKRLIVTEIGKETYLESCHLYWTEPIRKRF